MEKIYGVQAAAQIDSLRDSGYIDLSDEYVEFVNAVLTRQQFADDIAEGMLKHVPLIPTTNKRVYTPKFARTSVLN